MISSLHYRWYVIRLNFSVLLILSQVKLCTLALSISVTVANARYGFSRHIWDVVPTNFGPILICDFIAKIAFATAATFTRTSVLCFYSRLVVNSGIKWFRYVLIACHFFVAALCISFVLPMIFQCRYVEEIALRCGILLIIW